MSNTEYDAWVVEVRQIVEILSSLLDAKPVEELSDTQIRDKDGVVHDLTKLVGSPCVISTGVSYVMSIDDYHALNGPRWVTYGGHVYNSCEDLAKDISKHAEDPDVEITVHTF